MALVRIDKLSMRKKLLITLLLFAMLFLFRGTVYRLLVHYEYKAQRSVNRCSLAQEAIPVIDDSSLKRLTKQVLSITANELSFRKKNPSSNTAKILQAGYGNCIAYAKVASELIDCQNTSSLRFSATPIVASIYFLGISVHQFTSNPFFQDHDIVLVQDLIDGSTIAIDPSLYDYTGISYVSFNR